MRRGGGSDFFRSPTRDGGLRPERLPAAGLLGDRAAQDPMQLSASIEATSSLDSAMLVNEGLENTLSPRSR